MKKIFLHNYIIFLFFILIMSSGCTLPLSTFSPYNYHKELASHQYRKKMDHLIVILDASISMTQPYKGKEKFHTAIQVLHHLNASLTAIQIPIGFYILGTGTCHFCEQATQLFQLSPYQSERLDIQHLSKIHPGGETPINHLISSISDRFQSCSGYLGMIVISDFEKNSLQTQEAFQQICEKYTNRLTIACITVGQPQKKLDLSHTYAHLREQIQWYCAEEIFNFQAMKQFVGHFFLEPVDDRDQDGVNDKKDRCPQTPADAWVDTSGCPKDSDADGVFDGLDHCENSRPGAPVDQQGCWQLPVIFYKTNQFHMSRHQEKKLSFLTNLLKSNRICIEIQGHSDDSGAKEKIQDVSFRRAQSVMAYFLSQGVRYAQMQIKGFGAQIPLNADQALMKQASQRRVSFQIIDCNN